MAFIDQCSNSQIAQKNAESSCHDRLYKLAAHGDTFQARSQEEVASVEGHQRSCTFAAAIKRGKPRRTRQAVEAVAIGAQRIGRGLA